MSEKKWEKIEVRYNDRSVNTLYREDLEKLAEFIPLIEAFQHAKEMRERLKHLLK